MTLTVEYELGTEDVAAFRRVVALQRGDGRRQSWVILLFFGILLSLGIFAAAAKGTLPGLLQVAGPFIVVIGLIAFFLWRAMRNVSPESMKQLAATHRVEISDIGVAQSGEYGSSDFPWKVVPDIRHTDTHLFIFNGPNSAVVIPARAFATAADFKAFVAQSEEYRNARPPSPTPAL